MSGLFLFFCTMKVILFDDSNRNALFPLTLTRPVADIRVGILKIHEKWSTYLKAEVAFKTAPYLQVKFPFSISEENIFINGSVLPNNQILEAIDNMQEGDLLYSGETLLVAKINGSEAGNFDCSLSGTLNKIAYSGELQQIKYPEEIFSKNSQQIQADFDLLTKGRTSASLSSTNVIIGDNIFVEEGVEVECSNLNTKNGPIYLGRNSQVWEGSNIRGSFALCEDSQIKMGAKIYGGTTVGPMSRVGGEINNAVIFGYSAKGHDGYLGNAVVGEWCNFGADSNNSNMKNNYAEVKIWDYITERFRKTGLQFCGLIMGDHSKCGINTMFNTGTVVGVSANIFGAGFPRVFIPDFSWGGAQGFEDYALNKAIATAKLAYERKEKVFDEVEVDIFNHLYKLTEKSRRF